MFHCAAKLPIGGVDTGSLLFVEPRMRAVLVVKDCRQVTLVHQLPAVRAGVGVWIISLADQALTWMSQAWVEHSGNPRACTGLDS